MDSGMNVAGLVSTQRREMTHRQSRMSDMEGRSLIAPREAALSKGGIAGVVVGCVVAAVLLLFCLYPFVVRWTKKRKRHGTSTGLDLETAMVPGSGPAGHTGPVPELSRRLSSRDSFAPKPETLRGVERQSTSKELTLGSMDGVDYDGGARPQRGFSIDPSMGTRRHSGFSLGRVETFRGDDNDGPQTPGGIELSATRADGMEYSEAMGGHSADYYSPTIPSEAFGMVTPPPTDEPVRDRQSRRRSSSRTGSLKLSLMSLMRRMSTKDSATPTSPLSDTTGAPPLRTMGPPPVPEQISTQDISESPVTLTSPGFPAPSQISHPGLASPIRLQASPAASGVPEAGGQEASRAYIPPPVPTPGTVNPMDIMAPANETEHNWHTNQQLYHLHHNPSPPTQPQPSSPHLPDHSESATPRPSDHLSSTIPAVQDDGSVAIPPPIYPEAAHLVPTQSAPQDIEMSYGHTSYDGTHLMPVDPGHNGYLDGDYSSRSDRSTPIPSHSSSGPSTQATPDTRITDNSPSPRSDGSSELRSSASPYPGMVPSPRMFTCDECHREFDQVHKLNHHKRYHERPHECTHTGCGKRFGTKTHLDRHINDKHKKTRKYHCTEHNCPYSKAGGKSFPRKDNWRRHMMNIHSVNPQHDPEPDIIDENMMGT